MNLCAAAGDQLPVAALNLAATLDLEIIAEGIGTMDEYGLARQTGCRCGQGYLFSRPLPSAEAIRWVADSFDGSYT